MHFFVMDLPHSDGCFVKAYPAETSEAFCDGHIAAFDFFGGVPLLTMIVLYCATFSSSVALKCAAARGRGPVPIEKIAL